MNITIQTYITEISRISSTTSLLFKLVEYGEVEQLCDRLEQDESRNSDMSATSSVSDCDKPPVKSMLESQCVGEVTKHDGNNEKKCRIRKSRCITYDCEAKRMKTSVKEWGWLERKKLFGYKYRNISRIICTRLSGTSGH